MEQNKGTIKSDKLQKIHSLRNLKELLDSHHEGLEYTPAEENLEKDAESLETQYLAKFTATVRTKLIIFYSTILVKIQKIIIITGF